MKTNGKLKFMYVAVAALAISLASCGNKQKKAEDQAAQQDSVTVIQTETVIVSVDTVTPDSAAMPAKAPEKTK